MRQWSGLGHEVLRVGERSGDRAGQMNELPTFHSLVERRDHVQFVVLHPRLARQLEKVLGVSVGALFGSPGLFVLVGHIQALY